MGRTKQQPTVSFDVLLRSPGSGRAPSVTNIDQFRPPSDAIEKVLRFLIAKGMVCHSTDFGLACTAPRTLFESLFSVRLQSVDAQPGMPAWQISGTPKLPREIADLIEQFTIATSPESF